MNFTEDERVIYLKMRSPSLPKGPAVLTYLF